VVAHIVSLDAHGNDGEVLAEVHLEPRSLVVQRRVPRSIGAEAGVRGLAPEPAARSREVGRRQHWVGVARRQCGQLIRSGRSTCPRRRVPASRPGARRGAEAVARDVAANEGRAQALAKDLDSECNGRLPRERREAHEPCSDAVGEPVRHDAVAVHVARERGRGVLREPTVLPRRRSSPLRLPVLAVRGGLDGVRGHMGLLPNGLAGKDRGQERGACCSGRSCACSSRHVLPKDLGRAALGGDAAEHARRPEVHLEPLPRRRRTGRQAPRAATASTASAVAVEPRVGAGLGRGRCGDHGVGDEARLEAKGRAAEPPRDAVRAHYHLGLLLSEHELVVGLAAARVCKPLGCLVHVVAAHLEGLEAELGRLLDDLLERLGVGPARRDQRLGLAQGLGAQPARPARAASHPAPRAAAAATVHEAKGGVAEKPVGGGLHVVVAQLEGLNAQAKVVAPELGQAQGDHPPLLSPGRGPSRLRRDRRRLTVIPGRRRGQERLPELRPEVLRIC